MTLTSVSVEREDDIDLLRYGRFLASYWRLIAVCAAAGAVIGGVVAFAAPVRYQATVTMTVTQATTGTPLALTPATSRALLSNLTLVSETLKEAGVEGITPQAFVEDALTVQPVPTTTLLRMSVALPDPSKARLAADVLSRKAIALSSHLDEDGAIAIRDALKAQADEAARRFSDVASRLASFETTAQMERRSAEANALFTQQGETARAAADLDAEKSRLAALDHEASAFGTGRSASRDTATVSIAEGDGQHESPSRALNLPLADALHFEAAESRAKIAALQQRRRRAETGGGQTTARLNELYRLRVESDRLQTEYDAAKYVYGDLAGKYSEAAGRVTAHAAQLVLVDPAVQPDHPLPRQTARWALFGGILGFAVGIMAALLVNRKRAVSGGF